MSKVYATPLGWRFSPTRFYLWGLGLLIDFATPLGAGKVHTQLAPHPGHLPERFASFILIVLGEAIAGAVMGLTRHAWGFQSGLTAAMGLSLAFSLWWVILTILMVPPSAPPGSRAASGYTGGGFMPISLWSSAW